MAKTKSDDGLEGRARAGRVEDGRVMGGGEL